MSSDSQLLLDELERRRLQLGISKTRLAREVGVSRHTVMRKLSGETELSVGEAYAMCKALGTTLQDMLDMLETACASSA